MKMTKTSEQPTCKFCGTPLKTSTEFCTWHCRRDYYDSFYDGKDEDFKIEVDEYDSVDPYDLPLNHI